MKNITIKRATLKDIRPGWGAQIDVYNNKPYFAGYPLLRLDKEPFERIFGSNYRYSIILKTGLNAGIIALKHDDANIINNLK